MMKRLWRVAGMAAVVAGVAACNPDKLQVPQYNAPTVDGVNGSSNGVQLLATGILMQERNNRVGFVDDMGIFGRESYNYFPTDARNVSHYLIGQSAAGGGRQLDPTGFASGNWNQFFRNMKDAVNLIELADKQAGLSAQQKAATKGFARTFYALDLYYLLVSRDSLGTPTAITDDPQKPAPWVGRDAAWSYVSALLDSAKADLQAGGSAFPFAMHSGFTGFDAPATFLKFNRALAARVLVNRGSLGCTGCYQQALSALGESFIATPASQADLDAGVYHVFSASAGDALNGLNFVAVNYRFAHASTVKDAQKQADGSLDDRVSRKVAKLPAPRPAPGSNNGIPAEYYFVMYPSTTSPVAIIRNEELLLLRAEANIKTGNSAQALADLNLVRTISGKLPTLTSLGSDPIVTLLYERRMSLLWEGHRWNDMRRFGRLSDLPLDLSTHFVARVMPIPKTECDARPKALQPSVGC